MHENPTFAQLCMTVTADVAQFTAQELLTGVRSSQRRFTEPTIRARHLMQIRGQFRFKVVPITEAVINGRLIPSGVVEISTITGEDEPDERDRYSLVTDSPDLAVQLWREWFEWQQRREADDVQSDV